MGGFRILVADDHPVFRFGLCAVLGSHDGWEVCGEAGNGRETVEKYGRLKPDLLILDICLPKLNGVDVARQILKDSPAQRILVLTNVDSEEVIRECLDAGVRGWVLKSDGIDDVTTAVVAMQRNKCIFSSRVSDLLMDGLRRQHVDNAQAELPRLSPREREVVQLVAEGKTSREIGAILGLSKKTAETHRSNILLKLKLHSASELVLYAVRNQIVHVQLPATVVFPRPANGRANGAAQGMN